MSFFLVEPMSRDLIGFFFLSSLSGTSWAYLILLYVFVQASRLVVVTVLFPFLRYFGYGLDWKEATILTWSGLRGAVALSLSLSVKARLHCSIFNKYIDGIELKT